MITLSKADSQIILYAKGHIADRTYLLNDMRKLVAKRAGVDSQCVSDRDIVVVLTSILVNLNLKIADPKFIESVIFGTFWQANGDNALMNFLCAALGLIQEMKVFENGVRLVEIQPLDPAALD